MVVCVSPTPRWRDRDDVGGHAWERSICHTDTDPIKKSGHKSNHHLGFERAYAVMKYLVSRGVPESSIEVCSYGPNDPKSSKSTSRRVEISVVTD